jgi:hypothetical protein
MFSILGDVTDLLVQIFLLDRKPGNRSSVRGATHCTFVEHDSQNLSLFVKIWSILGLEQQSEIVRMDVLHF